MISVLRRRLLMAFVLTLLVIEVLDEIVFGVREAAWPLIRTDLGLNYIQIGILLCLPTTTGLKTNWHFLIPLYRVIIVTQYYKAFRG